MGQRQVHPGVQINICMVFFSAQAAAFVYYKILIHFQTLFIIENSHRLDIKIGQVLFVLGPVTQRCFLIFLFEDPVKSAHIGKSVIKSNVGDAFVGIDQIPHCVGQADLVQILVEGHIHVLLNEGGQILRGNIQLRSHVI